MRRSHPNIFMQGVIDLSGSQREGETAWKNREKAGP
jgi:hypothetical protein